MKKEVYLTTERCKECVHHDKLNKVYVTCGYIFDTGVSRGCPAGDQCTKFKRGKPDIKKRWEMDKRITKGGKTWSY